MRKYDQYKDSGIEWIGLIPDCWNMKKVSRSFGLIGSGTTPNTGNDEYYSGGKVHWINTGDLNDGFLLNTTKCVSPKAVEDLSALKIYPRGSLVIAMYGATIGKIALYEIEACVNQACCVLNRSNDFLQKFIFYWFLMNRQNIINLSYGGGQPNISQDIIRTLKIPGPSIGEQKIIIGYLDKKVADIDSCINKKQQLISLLHEEKAALINHAVTKGIDADAPMKPSGIEWLGDTPEHWVIKKLKHVAYLKSGNSITSDEIMPDGEYPVFGGNGKRGFYSAYTHEGTHVLIGRQGALCGNINYAHGLFWASEHAIVCHIKDDSHYKWLGELLRSMNLNQYSQSAAQPGLAVENISNLHIPVPNAYEQTRIIEHIETATEKIEKTISKVEKEIELLLEYKTSLINDVVTGKVKIDAPVEETLEAAL